MNRKAFWLAAVGVLAALTAGSILVLRDSPGPLRRIAPRVTKGEIVVAYPSEPMTLFPYSLDGDTLATRDLLRPVLPTLLEITPQMEYRSGLAIRVPTANGKTRISFRLNPSARWSDGTPITADDVRFTWEVIRAVDGPERGEYAGVKDVIASGRHEVTLVLDEPLRAWRDLFSAGDFILPKHALTGKDSAAELARAVRVSGGPFVIETWIPGLEIVYAANPNWWGPKPLSERVRVQFVPDLDTALYLLQNGRVQVIAASTAPNLEHRIERRGARSLSSFGSAWWELAFNLEKPGPNEDAWRGAVARSFDRRGFHEALIREEGKSLNRAIPALRIPGEFTRYSFARAEATSALEQSGFRKGSEGYYRREGVGEVQLSWASGAEVASLLGRSIQAGLRATGIDIEVVSPRQELFWQQWRNGGRFEMAVWERRSSPAPSLASYFHSSRRPPHGHNYYRVASGPLDQATEAFDISAADPREAAKSLADALSALPLFEVKAYLGVRPGVLGPEPNATIEGPFWNLEDWDEGN